MRQLLVFYIISHGTENIFVVMTKSAHFLIKIFHLCHILLRDFLFLLLKNKLLILQENLVQNVKKHCRRKNQYGNENTVDGQYLYRVMNYFTVDNIEGGKTRSQ